MIQLWMAFLAMQPADRDTEIELTSWVWVREEGKQPQL